LKPAVSAVFSFYRTFLQVTAAAPQLQTASAKTAASAFSHSFSELRAFHTASNRQQQ
jgi:hypothetical protein